MALKLVATSKFKKDYKKGEETWAAHERTPGSAR